MSDKPVSEMSFEEAMKELEQVVGQLERGDVALELRSHFTNAARR